MLILIRNSIDRNKCICNIPIYDSIYECIYKYFDFAYNAMNTKFIANALSKSLNIQLSQITCLSYERKKILLTIFGTVSQFYFSYL